VLGALPEFALAEPWWMETAAVVDGVRERFGVDTYVVRLVSTEGKWPPHGGAVTYLAEAVGGPVPPGLPLAPIEFVDGDDPKRAPWARPGGVAALVAWADAALAGSGVTRTGPAIQLRTWNLSCVLVLSTTAGRMWLKAVPPFFAHEPRALALLGADPVSRDVVPELAAAGECVSLMRDVPGADLYEAGRPDLDRMIDALVALQVRWVGAVDALLAAGLPDRRRAGLLAAIEGVAGRADVRARLDDGEVRALDALVDGLPARLDAVGECGLPDTLVHADFHPGNWRGEPGGRLTLLDWGDCVVGNPITDQEAFLLMVSRLRGEDEAAALRAPWSAAWKDAVPGCDPDRAAALLAPVTALERAAIFQGFLDGIEVAEHPYHAHDPEDCLRQAISRQ
jgi:hypothetical protein